MFYYIPILVPNTAPTLGPVVGGKQSVSIYDRKTGGRRSILVPKFEAEDYILKSKQ